MILRLAFMVGLMAFAQPAAAHWECGRAGLFCDCAALFSVLESEDDDQVFEQKMRDVSQRLYEQAVQIHGSDLVDRAMDRMIKDMQARETTPENAIWLGQQLSKCSQFFTGEPGEVPQEIVP